MQQIVDGTALSNDMQGKLEYTKLYPAMFNSPEHVEKAKALLEEALGPDKVILMIRRAGGEDFSFITKKVPSVFLWLGTETDFNKGKCILHNPEFMADENSIKVGIKVLCKIVLDRLNSLE